MSIIILIAVIIAGMLIERRVYERRWDESLEARISFSVDRTVEGGTSELVEVVEHTGRLPLPWLTVKFQASRDLKLPDSDNVRVTDYYYREDIFSIKPGERVTRRLPVQCEKRGLHRIHSIDLISRDMFMLSRLVKNMSGSAASIIVYPKLVDVSDISYETRRLMGEYITKKRTMEDPFVFRGLRDYVEGDSPRSINWRASAKSDRMTVNQYESTTSLSASIWLNCDSGAGWINELVGEESIRIASSMAAELIGSGVPVSLCTNGIDCLTRVQAKNITAGSSPQHYETINTTLARLDITRECRRMHETIEEMLGDSQPEDFVIIISSDTNRALIERALALADDGREVLWIAVARRDDMRTFEELDAVNHYIWRMAI